MIILVATRVDDRGHFRYAVEGGQRSIVTEDPTAVVGALQGVGVNNPYRFISHAEQWGMVEVFETRHLRH